MEEATGVIVERRSHGKHLAFCTILVDTRAHENHEENDNLQHDFQVNKDAESFPPDMTSAAGVTTEDPLTATPTQEQRLAFMFQSKVVTNLQGFPTKASMLPFGAQIWVRYEKQKPKRETHQDHSNYTSKNTKSTVTSKPLSHLVHDWKLLTDPKSQAQQSATLTKEGGGGGAMSYSKYLEQRADCYFRYHACSCQPRVRTTKKQGGVVETVSTRTDTTITDIHNPHSSDRRGGVPPAKSFAQFLQQTFPHIKHVLDVAGGKAQLTKALLQSNAQIVSSTVVDPMIRKSCWKQAQQSMQLQEHRFRYLPAFFNTTTFVTEHAALLDQTDTLVALHPDEATEHVLDVALRHGKNVAIVPCCVFPNLFPHRSRPRDGQPVETYEDFLDYLLAKHDALQLATLPFEGRNQVLYLKR